jgi:hypothetical protein
MPAACRYLCTYVDRQEDAADLMQMVFLRAMLALPRYRSEGSTHIGIGIAIPGDLIIPRPAVL